MGQLKVGIVMDPISRIRIYKDSSFAMLLEAQRREYKIYYIEQNWIYSNLHESRAHAHVISVTDNVEQHFDIISKQDIALSELDIILMRKDPPFDLNYIYTSYLLEDAEQKGSLVVNAPSALRNFNEKMALNQFPDCAPKTLVTSNISQLRIFLENNNDIIIKPLDGMGGSSIFRVKNNDNNANVIFETLTKQQTIPAMAQKYIPEISSGDKRILVIDGTPIPYALARIPGDNDHRGNLAAGGSSKGVDLSDNDYAICDKIAPKLKQAGIIFAGIDVIGNYLTEINITSPTCIRELDNIYDINIAASLFDSMEKKLKRNL